MRARARSRSSTANFFVDLDQTSVGRFFVTADEVAVLVSSTGQVDCAPFKQRRMMCRSWNCNLQSRRRKASQSSASERASQERQNCKHEEDYEQNLRDAYKGPCDPSESEQGCDQSDDEACNG